MLETDLIDQVIQIPTPTESDPGNFTFGRVRAVYVANGVLRLGVLLTTGYLIDIQAHMSKCKKKDNI